MTLLMLLGLGLFIPLEWDRFPLWLLGLIVAAVAFGAMGTAIGARESRWHRCWLCFAPAGCVSRTGSIGCRERGSVRLHAFRVRVVPFKPTLKLMSSVLYDEGMARRPAPAPPCPHGYVGLAAFELGAFPARSGPPPD